MNLRKNKGRMCVPITSAPRMGVTEETYFGGFRETRVTNHLNSLGLMMI